MPLKSVAGRTASASCGARSHLEGELEREDDLREPEVDRRRVEAENRKGKLCTQSGIFEVDALEYF